MLGQILTAHPDLIAARYYAGAYSEQIGDTDGAKRAYEWFVTAPHDYLHQWQNSNANGRSRTPCGCDADRQVA